MHMRRNPQPSRGAALGVLLGFWLLLAPQWALARSVALVIGNASYDHESRLSNPLNDARRMEAVLRGLGFDEVRRVENAGRAQMSEALGWLSQRAAGADTATIFYSGHAIEIGGVNYLIPVDARLASPDRAPLEAVRLSDALAVMHGADRLRLAFIDACRNNSFLSATKGGSKGLERPDMSLGRMLVSFATRPGFVAWDGEGSLSPYTQALAEKLEGAPHGDLRLTLTELEPRLKQLTANPQEPWLERGAGFREGEHVSITGRRPETFVEDPCSMTALQSGQRCVVRDGKAVVEMVASMATGAGNAAHAPQLLVEPPSQADQPSEPSPFSGLTLVPTHSQSPFASPEAQAPTLSNPRLVRTLTLQHDSNVVAVAFSKDGRRILSGSLDNTARLWDVETGREILRLPHRDPVKAVAFSPDGRNLVTGARLTSLWDAETGQALLSVYQWNRLDPRLSEISGPGEVLTPDQRLSEVSSVAFSPDGRRILSGTRSRSGGVTHLLNIEDERELLYLPYGAINRSLAFSPDGRRILVGAEDKTIRLWDVETGTLLQRLYHDEPVISVSFSPDGRQLLSGSLDKRVRVWDAETGRRLLQLSHDGHISSAVFSPDGGRIFTGAYGAGAETAARLWDAETGRELMRLPLEGLVQSAAFSPDGQRLFIAVGPLIQIWDLP